MSQTDNRNTESLHRGPVLRLVQITDSHLFNDPSKELAGMNCEESLSEVLKLVETSQPELDAFLCTGDLVQDASKAGYLRFFEAVARFGKPQYWLAGNHDELLTMSSSLGDNSSCMSKSVVMKNWQIILVNSNVPNKIHGEISPEALKELEETLEESKQTDRYVLICIHHNPVPVKAQWLQKHCLQNADDFFSIIDKYVNVKSIIYGHVHQENEVTRKKVKILSSPSTCIQFHPEKETFTLDKKNPGYRWLNLYEDGSIETAVERVAGREFQVDLNSSGY